MNRSAPNRSARWGTVRSSGSQEIQERFSKYQLGGFSNGTRLPSGVCLN